MRRNHSRSGKIAIKVALVAAVGAVGFGVGLPALRNKSDGDQKASQLAQLAESNRSGELVQTQTSQLEEAFQANRAAEATTELGPDRSTRDGAIASQSELPHASLRDLGNVANGARRESGNSVDGQFNSRTPSASANSSVGRTQRSNGLKPPPSLPRDSGSVAPNTGASPLPVPSRPRSASQNSDSGTQINFSDQNGPGAETQAAVSGDNERSESVAGNVVEVFYATDRELVDPSSRLIWAKIWLPFAVAVLIASLMIVAASRSSTRWVWGIGGFVGVALACWFGQDAWFASQRLTLLSQAGSVAFSNARGGGVDYPLHLGVGSVSIPEGHQAGTVERPSILTLDWVESEQRHVVIQSVTETPVDAYFDALGERVARSQSDDAFVFIHGYNVSFDEALRRAAQLHHDLEFAGTPLLYSWPSHGSLLRYTQDEGNSSWSITHFERFLTDVRERTNVDRVHIIAHSMGNRVLLGALERMALAGKFKDRRLGQILLAAPDVDVDEFRNRYVDTTVQAAEQVTLYISGADRALQASMHIHGYERLGLQRPDGLAMFPGVQLIDVSPVDTSLVGHSYYGSSSLLLKDMRAIVELGATPKQRAWLSELNRKETLVSYRFRPDAILQAVNR
jgi:esterase/lipase superfamily enzyme